MSQDVFSRQVEAFLTGVEEKRHQIATGRKPADLGRFFAGASGLFSESRIAEVQRALAAAEGAEERRLRALLEFLARGHALRAAGDAMDRKLAWASSAVVQVGEEAYAFRSIPTHLRMIRQTRERHQIAAAYLDLLGARQHLAEEFLLRHGAGLAELGYGSHLHAFQVLGGIDLEEMLKEGAKFLADTEGMYLDLLSYHLPRSLGISRSDAVPADALRLLAGADLETIFTTGSLRGLAGTLTPAGVDPRAEARITFEWGPPDEAALATCRVLAVPGDVRVRVAPAPGRAAAAAFLFAHGVALHNAYTDPELTVAERRLGDEAVPLGSGKLLESLLSSATFMARTYGLPRSKVRDYLGFSALVTLYAVRRDIALLQFEAAFHADRAGADEYVQLLTAATGIQHDGRAALWEIEGDFASAGRLRAVQLGAVHVAALRHRFDEDWFRNPAAGGYLRDLFSNGRRYRAPELAVQLGRPKLSFDAVLAELSSHV